MYDKIRQNSYSNIEIELCCCVYYFFFCVRSKIIHYTLKRSDKVEHIPLIFEKMISRINFVLSCARYLSRKYCAYSSLQWLNGKHLLFQISEIDTCSAVEN